MNPQTASVIELTHLRKLAHAGISPMHSRNRDSSCGHNSGSHNRSFIFIIFTIPPEVDGHIAISCDFTL